MIRNGGAAALFIWVWASVHAEGAERATRFPIGLSLPAARLVLAATTGDESVAPSRLAWLGPQAVLPSLGEMLDLRVSGRPGWDLAQSEEDSGDSVPLPKPPKVTKKSQATTGDYADLPFKPPNPPKPWRKPVGWTGVGVGAAALISGAICYAYSSSLSNETFDNADDEKANQDKIHDLNVSSLVLFSAGAAVLIAGTALLLWEEYAPLKAEVDVAPDFAGVSVSGSFW